MIQRTQLNLGRAATLWGLWGTAFIVLLQGGAAQACKYSVRDVGFVDLQAAPYRLFCVLDGKRHGDFAQQFERAAAESLAGCNVRTEVIDVSSQRDHPLLQRSQATQLPRLVLAAASEELPLLSFEQLNPADLSGELRQMVTSPMREKILSTIISAYAVVVVIEGPTEQANVRAGKAANFAIEELNGIMQELDKPVAVGPKLVTISNVQAKRERVLLWSWGIDVDQITEPSVVLLFGRGRRMGPVHTGSAISGTEVFETLALVGKSCECELDRSWMQGPMFPHRWDAVLREQATDLLGFDAENPLVKVEISRIIARGPSNRPATENVIDDEIDPLLGYGEFDIGVAENEPVEPSLVEATTAPPVEKDTATATIPQTKKTPIKTTPRDTDEQAGLSAISTGLLTVIAIGIIAIAGGLIVLFRTRGQV